MTAQTAKTVGWVGIVAIMAAGSTILTFAASWGACVPASKIQTIQEAQASHQRLDAEIRALEARVRPMEQKLDVIANDAAWLKRALQQKWRLPDKMEDEDL